MNFFKSDPTRKLILNNHGFTKHHDCRQDKSEPQFKDRYELCEKINGLPRTYKCVFKATGDARSVKIMPRKLEDSFWEELNILKAMESAYFPRIFESFEDETHLFFVFERTDNMYNLIDAVHQVAQVKRYSEKDVAMIIRVVLFGLEYTHHVQVKNTDTSNKEEPHHYVAISHGSIHYKNILVTINPDKPDDMLEDFLVANLEAAGVHLIQPDGSVDLDNHDKEALLGNDTDHTVDSSDSDSDDEEDDTTTTQKKKRKKSHFDSPEYYEVGPTPKGDIYSLGILANYLLTGKYPFQTIPKSGSKDPPNEIDYSGIKSTDFKKFIHHALHMDPAKRPSAKRALKNDHYNLKNLFSEEEVEESHDQYINEDVMKSLTQARIRHKLQDTVTYYIANYLTYENDGAMIELATSFHFMDTNGDGVLTKQELANSLASVNIILSDKELKAVMDRMDLDKSGSIDLKEFLATAADTASLMSEKHLRAAFEEFDVSKTNYITVSDLMSVLNGPSPDEKVISKKAAKAMIAKADLTKDGQLSFEEFRAMMWASRVTKNDDNKSSKDDIIRSEKLALEFSKELRFQRQQELAGWR
ncbi:ATP binding calcium ion binding calmodulin-dependent protein kinase kinase protein kinase protein serine threonine kinase [Seminavis robusta]|uniref:ATP binding calcium ion binding calmodulin-dependent protein kinase kinase protein kinase protein serine threonine kinase n=1 Tax=Seminavis robusta TaxID=568900 RepID=A0A9N8E888_9STRA|nr:ATP binding calcium ion binding calmodulin-dependent protein kinase kinase protein kinase protein serine threonine kinase [Seminavis robusta]|eukprot:Sro729_g193810.1 ATP binding calcium ion binding calmodulin-dependent protein kinase kinase protein kinase protein serine threonine kinase (585) ;mRNA; r:15151-16984